MSLQNSQRTNHWAPMPTTNQQQLKISETKKSFSPTYSGSSSLHTFTQLFFRPARLHATTLRKNSVLVMKGWLFYLSTGSVNVDEIQWCVWRSLFCPIISWQRCTRSLHMKRTSLNLLCTSARHRASHCWSFFIGDDLGVHLDITQQHHLRLQPEMVFTVLLWRSSTQLESWIRCLYSGITGAAEQNR